MMMVPRSDHPRVEPQPRLSIIIVSWNVADLIENCIASIQQTANDLSCEIIVVDNASNDGSAGLIAARFPEVRLIRNHVNVGFPHANNQALPLTRGDYVLYLNPDTRLEPGTLAACVAELDQDPGLGMVGCRLETPDGGTQYECARRTYHLRHLIYEALYLHMFFPRSPRFADHVMGWWDHRDVRDVEALAGAFMMVRRSVAVELGGLPEDLFMYHEDLSFCLRVLRRGWRIRYRGDVTTIHYGAQSSARSDLRLDLLRSECRFLLIREADGRAAAAVARVIWALAGGLRLGVAVFGPLAPRLARRYPRVFDVRTQASQVVWSLAPRLLSNWLPRAPADQNRPARAAAGVV